MKSQQYWLRMQKQDVYRERSAPSSLALRNVVVAGHRTSVRLEPGMWEALEEIRKQKGMTLHALVTEIAGQQKSSSLTSEIRMYIVDYYRAMALRARDNLKIDIAAQAVRSRASASRSWRPPPGRSTRV